MGGLSPNLCCSDVMQNHSAQHLHKELDIPVVMALTELRPTTKDSCTQAMPGERASVCKLFQQKPSSNADCVALILLFVSSDPRL